MLIGLCVRLPTTDNSSMSIFASKFITLIYIMKNSNLLLEFYLLLYCRKYQLGYSMIL